MTEEQYKTLCTALNIRDRLILQISADTGLRVSDILNLNCNIKQSFSVKEQKTGKIKRVRLKKRIYEDLQLYIKLNQSKEKIFDCTRQSVHRNISAIAQKLAYNNISIHSARKYYAKCYYAKNGLKKTQAVLNHDSTATTMLYIFDVSL